MKSILLATFFAMFSAPAFAGTYMSAHSCQPYQHGGTMATQLYYQNQGSILAVAETDFMCPVPVTSPANQQHVKVYYQSQGAASLPAVSCTFWRITANNLSFVSPKVVSQANLNAGAFDIYSTNGSVDTIGYNLQCHMKAGSKILGYFVY